MKSKALLLVVVLGQLTCHQVPLLAPPGTEIGCQPHPPTIAAFSGVSEISCLLMEGETGTPVADGTVVQFFTTIGRIPEQGKTNDGVVRVNLEADGRSGNAVVRVASGGGVLPSSSSSITVTTTPVQRGVSASDAASEAASVAMAQAMVTTEVTVVIGNASARQLLLSANPPRITQSRSTQIVATVFDEFGNPIAGVPVFFSLGDTTIVNPSPTPTATPTGTPTPPPATSPGGTVYENLDSQGAPIFTDTNGRATDTLNTRWPREAQVRTVTVTATVPVNNLRATTTVTIN
jgi:hypothetical protein